MESLKVEVVETTLVVPSEETPRQGLWLSNLDLIVPKTYTPLVYYYPASTTTSPPTGDDFFSPDRLRASLARALVLFYPLAGRLGVDTSGRLQIDCNGKGVLFVVARSDCAGEDLFRDFKPSPEIRSMLVPSRESPCLAMFQVTFLKCGGVVLGTAVHHVPMDGVGSFHFIQTWTGLARGLSISEACPTPPSHDRTALLCARSPPRADMDHQVYLPGDPTGPSFTTRVYSISSKLLTELKSRCAPGVSTYGVVASHVWRCHCVARGLAPGSHTRLLGPANVRHRLNPPLPREFSGNAIVRSAVTMKVGDVLAEPLGNVADTIKNEVGHVDDVYVRSVIDYLQIEHDKKDSNGPRGMCFSSESDLWVVSWLGMPMYDADFGWGLPRFVFPVVLHFRGMVFLTQRADRNDGITLLLALEPHNVQRFEQVFYGGGGTEIYLTSYF